MSSSSQEDRPRKRNRYLCSTPVYKGSVRLSSITLSAIDTQSSSSGKVRASSRKTSKVVENYRGKRTRRKRYKRIKPRDSDSDWETKSEESVHGDLSPQKSTKSQDRSNSNPIEFGCSFDYNRSPEKIRRQAPVLFYDDGIESPILRPRKSVLIPEEENTFNSHDEPIQIEKLPSLRGQIPSEDDSDEDFQPVFRKPDGIKTYAATVKKAKETWKPAKHSDWLVNVRVPTASSDLLWDNFVRENREEVNQYLHPSNRISVRPFENLSSSSLTTFFSHKTKERTKEKNGNTGKMDETKRKGKTKGSSRKKMQSPQLSPEMQTIRGYCNRSSRKWKRYVVNEYAYPEQEDVEFEKGGKDGGRMTVKEFRQKNREKKRSSSNTQEKKRSNRDTNENFLTSHTSNVYDTNNSLLSSEQRNFDFNSLGASQSKRPEIVSSKILAFPKFKVTKVFRNC